MNDLDKAGVYAIINIESNRVYIGSTGRSFNMRWKEHKTALQDGCHGNPYLQYSWNKYGEKVFDFQILAISDNPNRITIQELQWLDIFQSQGIVYNTMKVIHSPIISWGHSEETKRKIGESGRGRRHTKEAKQKISDAGKGSIFTDKRRYNISVGLLKYFKTHNSHNKGKKHLEETKRKIGKGNKGQKRSEELRLQMSISRKGKPNGKLGIKHSEKAKLKMSKAHKGKRPSEETKRKMSISQKKRYARKKNTGMVTGWLF